MSSKPSGSVAVVDCNTTLCLACSSSLPPSKSKLPVGIFITACCMRPICNDCLTSNPRLARYDPCLACLGGVGAINAGNNKRKQLYQYNVNIDGAVRDEDTFVVGDEETDSEDEQIGGSERRSSSPPPPYDTSPNVLPADELESLTPGTSHATQEDQAGIANGSSIALTDIPAPTKYYVKPGDNLQGIALRFGVNGRELCRLNNLPPSTLTTTPHILHTRAFLTLPPSARSKSKALLNGAADKDQEARLTRERAEKRLQTLTKEVDWRVAKAYVALADIPDVDVEDMKGKETHKRLNNLGSGDLRSKLEERAVTRYLDDEEWEKSEGGKVSIQGFPYFSGGKSSTSQGNSSRAFWIRKS